MVTGDPIEAAALGTLALNWAGTLLSRRTVDDCATCAGLANRTRPAPK